jgi:hypothetical protein
MCCNCSQVPDQGEKHAQRFVLPAYSLSFNQAVCKFIGSLFPNPHGMHATVSMHQPFKPLYGATISLFAMRFNGVVLALHVSEHFQL